MKSNYIHVCFVIDQSGSMSYSVSDVKGGFKQVIDEQKANQNGTCSVSLFKFESNVEEVFIGKDVNEIEELSYSPGGLTALYDGVGTAIDKIGKWLASLPEEERPEKNMIIVMTDGMENSSIEYSGAQVKAKIKHQEDKYNWSFVYMGTDITNTDDADTLGFTTKIANTRSDLGDSYAYVTKSLNTYRNTDGDFAVKNACLTAVMCSEAGVLNDKYEAATGIKIN